MIKPTTARSLHLLTELATVVVGELREGSGDWGADIRQGVATHTRGRAGLATHIGGAWQLLRSVSILAVLSNVTRRAVLRYFPCRLAR